MEVSTRDPSTEEEGICAEELQSHHSQDDSTGQEEGCNIHSTREDLDEELILETADSFWIVPSPPQTGAATPEQDATSSVENEEDQESESPRKSSSTLETEGTEQNDETSQDEERRSRQQRQRALLVLFVALFVVALVTVGIVLCLTLGRRSGSSNENNNDARGEDTMNPDALIVDWRTVLIQENISSHDSFMDPNTPQSQALFWLVYQDEVLVKQDGINQTTIVQRYILLVLAYACGGDQWSRVGEQWTNLGDKHECEWGFVDCQNGSVVTSLHMSAIAMVGTIPEEIGSLTNLGTLHHYSVFQNHAIV